MNTEEYLNNLKWDGVRRLATWLQRAFKASDDERYLELIGPKILIGAVARALSPGCRVINTLVLEGNQGVGKSTALALLFGDGFYQLFSTIGGKDAVLEIQGKWAVEITEADSLDRAEISFLKGFLSVQVDSYRPAYSRDRQELPRQMIFVLTTNLKTFLPSYEGSRRLWPVCCERANSEWLRKYRVQLWAEAVRCYKDQVRWWVDREDDIALIREVQDSRFIEVVDD